MRHRIGLISNVFPVVDPLVGTLRDMGHEPVAWLMSRKPPGDQPPPPPWGDVTDRMAPEGRQPASSRAARRMSRSSSAGSTSTSCSAGASAGSFRRRHSTCPGSAR